jgi:hypothetical protein
MYPISIHGRQYVVSTDESGGAGGAGGLAGACARGASPFGYPNIIDITDEKNPTIVAKLKLEVSDAANCSLMVSDPPDIGAGTPAYNVERCVANRPNNPTMLACSFQNAGLRVFDISDLSQPKEIAYYKPPAPRAAFLPGSGSWSQGVDLTVDRIAGYARFQKVLPSDDKVKGKGNGNGNGSHGPQFEIWTVSDGNGFQIVRFSDDFVASHRDLFKDPED